MKNIEIAHAPTSRILLVLSYLLLFWWKVECFGGPPLVSSTLYNQLGPERAVVDCEVFRKDSLCGPKAARYVRTNPQPCPPCPLNRSCKSCMMLHWIFPGMAVVALLAVLGIALTPRAGRT
ncbi:hypothetical protein KDL45_11020 [bacterium]|nr:hypothetical protein [bacterium]MCB9476198.1 hypothetical protein [Deltaproteobacteria bacterium]